MIITNKVIVIKPKDPSKCVFGAGRHFIVSGDKNFLSAEIGERRFTVLKNEARP